MPFIIYKKITHILLTLLITFGLSSFLVPIVFAQSVIVTELDNDPVISVTAHVPGCGDNIIQPGLGEQCDGLNLNSQSCVDIGFTGGDISCRPSCIFDTSSCTKRTGSKVDPINTGVAATNVVFTGTGEPNSTFFVITPDGYFISVPVDANGYFSVTVSEPIPGDYDFSFYTLSINGLFGPVNFSHPIVESATTYINNIFIPYPLKEEILPEELIEPAPLSTDQDGTDNQVSSSDLYAEFLGILGENENLSPDELRELIKEFSEKNGYEAEIPGYNKDELVPGILPYLKYQWDLLPGKSDWYPNVYTSFLGPYRTFFYETTGWFKELDNPLMQLFIAPRETLLSYDNHMFKNWYPNVYTSFLGPYRTFFYETTGWFKELNNPVTQWILSP